VKKAIPAALLLTVLCTLRSGTEVKVVRADDKPKWTKAEIPLTVDHDDKLGIATAEGFWQATSTESDRQLISPIAVKISCDRSEKICRESDATVLVGVLKADLLEYDVSSWNDKGVVADDNDAGKCGIAHRLSLDFKSNSVTVTDYPKKTSTDDECKGLQDANSFALRGGELVLYPPVGWGPVEKAVGKN